eukprot:TRINITY_DN30788_c0_g2_i1.p1 TRINITY_DN30788_c0_g2~~TRINITY_DN30788_c0_g2_i1.p1  ORF type:complete len:391 (-),score=67.28 TRINITY_DN30788_c0_g2_i1:274-1347(-)
MSVGSTNRLPAGPTGGDGGVLLAALHRACSEAFMEKVAVFTPTGRVLYLPRDATPLDFAVWNLGAQKGLRAEAATIDGSEAPLCTKLIEGQTVLVHLRNEEDALPPREWAGVHLRYLRTNRARSALVEVRSQMLSFHQACDHGRLAIEEELTLHSLDHTDLLVQLGDEVFAAIGRGALPIELVSGQLLSARLDIPLGDAGHEYIVQSSMAVAESNPLHQASGRFVLAFLLIAEDRPGLLGEVITVIREQGLDTRRLNAEPFRRPGAGHCLCRFFAEVTTDCALRFGSLMHHLRYATRPSKLQRVPTELGVQGVDSWLGEVLDSADHELTAPRQDVEEMNSTRRSCLVTVTERRRSVL